MKIKGQFIGDDATSDHGVAILAAGAACVGVANPLWAIILLLVLVVIKL